MVEDVSKQVLDKIMQDGTFDDLRSQVCGDEATGRRAPWKEPFASHLLWKPGSVSLSIEEETHRVVFGEAQ